MRHAVLSALAARSVAAVAAVLLAGCGGAAGTGTLTVFAAASLKGTFTEIGEQFQAANPGTTVTFSFAGSSDLAALSRNGAPADVFASADQANMATVTEAGLADATPEDFATNVLTIVTPPGNPRGVASFADLADPGTAVVVCAPQVPCGAAAQKVEQATGVDISPVSEEASVTDVLTKVEAGEADAGLVYVTDATGAAGRVTEVTFPESSGAVNSYPIVALTDAAAPELAQAFTDYVTGPDGQAVLAAAGFGAP